MTTRRSLLTPAAAGSVVLTMLALNQVFVRQRWLFPSLVGVGVAFLVGWAARRLDVPAILSPALSMLAMVTLVGIFFHGGTTFAGVPTGETMRAIGESLRQAGVDLQELAAPADATDALTLLATMGVFFVAVIVDIVVFRMRRPVAAGIPLLALFLIPTSLAEKANVFAFVLAAFGYLGLLVAEGRDRARAWGRRLSGVERADETADVSHVARVGRRLGSAAVGLAIALPVAIPSVGDGVLGGNGGGPFGNGDGPSRIVVISPIAEIAKQLHSPMQVDLFTVRPHDGRPNGYTRLTSLDEFTGNDWRLMEQQADDDNRVGAKNPIPQPPEHEGEPAEERTFDVAVGPLAVQWLPVPYSPRVVDIDSKDWKYESTTMSVFTARARRNSKDTEYTATALTPTPTVEQLRAGGPIPRDIIRRYLALPQRGVKREVEDILAGIVGDLDNQYDKALALQDFFLKKGSFTYDLDAPEGTSEDALIDFLTQRRGYCEQFAATMAYLARLEGIPARVAVGFTRGTARPDGTWVVTNRDAHAWPELYFANVGWVRFEPTPRNDQQTVTPYYAPPPAESPVPPGGPGGEIVPTPSAAPEPDESGRPRGAEEAQDQEQSDSQLDEVAAPGSNRGGGLPPLVTAGLALVAVALATPSVVAYLARRRRRSAAAGSAARTHAAWDALADAAEDTGYAMRGADSPRAAGRRLVAAAGLSGTAADEVVRMAAAEERARYAREAPAVDGLDASARLVRRALMATLPKRRRVRALVFPASALRRLREAYGRGIETLDRTRDALRARVVAVVRRRPAPGRAG